MLTTAQIREIIQTIVNGYNPEKVYLFGSYANGTARKDSDLDICVIKETNERAIDRRVKVQSLFNPYPHSMDILVYTPGEFEERKNTFGTMAYFISLYMKKIYEKQL